MNPHPYDSPAIAEDWHISRTKIVLGLAVAAITPIYVGMAFGNANPLFLVASAIEHVIIFAGGIYCGCTCWQRSQKHSA